MKILAIVIAAIIFLLFAFLESVINFTFSAKIKYKDKSQKEDRMAKEFLNSAKDIYTNANDNVKLHASLKVNDERKFLISLHGYKGSAEENALLYRHMYENGYSVLVPDMRGHGKSGGAWITFGYKEKDDLISWIDYINSNFKNAKITLHGVSMGASTIALALKDVNQTVTAAILDCGYSSLYEELSINAKHMCHLPSHPTVDLASLYSKFRLGFNFKKVNPEESIKDNHIKTLFIHGSDDKFVPTYMVYRLYDAAKCEKELWITNGVKHAKSLETYTDEYRSRVLSFIEEK